MTSTPLRVVVALLALAFFFGPALARITGKEPEAFENRPLSSFPSLSEGFDIFEPLDRWTVDHLPLRSNAVRLNTRLTKRIFGEEPVQTATGGPVGTGQVGDLAGDEQTREEPGAAARSPVVNGTNGWIYLTQELELACNPQIEQAQVERGLVRLESIVRSSGRRFLLVVPPDKSTFEGENLPDDNPDKECAERTHRKRISALRSLGLKGFVDVQAALELRRRRDGLPIYLPDDTHWTQRGAVTYSTALARALDPRLMERTRVARWPDVRQVGDLSKLAGDARESTVPSWVVLREGVSPNRVSNTRIFPTGNVTRERRTATPGQARLYPGRTVLFADSFTQVSLGQTTPFFEDLTRPPGLDFAEEAGHLAEAQQALIDLIFEADTFIYQRAERGLWNFPTTNLVRPRFLNQLEAALK